jgi:hypothetical protein
MTDVYHAVPYCEIVHNSYVYDAQATYRAILTTER